MAQLKAEMDLLKENEYGNYGCLVICLLSHGTENAIACADGQLVNINELQYKFLYESCPSLYGKPKIFIVQACQGVLGQNNTGIDFPSRKRKSSLFISKSVPENKIIIKFVIRIV